MFRSRARACSGAVTAKGGICLAAPPCLTLTGLDRFRVSGRVALLAIQEDCGVFDQLVRELRRIGGEVQVPLPPDSDGYLDRACPFERCRSEFKVQQDDWVTKVSKEAAHCPQCRHAAPAGQWATERQVTQAKKIATAQIDRRIGEALQRDAYIVRESSTSRTSIVPEIRANRLGQQLIVTADSASACADLVRKLGTGLRRDVEPE